MTGAWALAEFAASLSSTEGVLPGSTAVLLADYLTLAGRTHGGGEINLARAMTAAVRASAGDADDVHWDSLVHPGAIIWPVVLEVGLSRRSSGPEISRAARVGYEAMVRLGVVLAPLAAQGHHLTALVGGVGAAAAASVLLDGEVSTDALGHALSVAGGSSGALVERSGTRSFHRGQAVLSGLAAALEAQRGLVSTRGDLERGGGVLPQLSSSAAEMLGLDYDALATTSVRPFPTSGWNHPAYEAAIEAARDVNGPIRSIEISVHERTRSASSMSLHSPSDEWSHLGHSVARAVASIRQDQSVCELLAIVTLAGRIEPGARVTLATSGGVCRADVLVPLGHPQRPLNVSDLARKWSMPVMGAGNFLASVERWLADPRPRDLAELVATISAPTTITFKE